MNWQYLGGMSERKYKNFHRDFFSPLGAAVCRIYEVHSELTLQGHELSFSSNIAPWVILYLELIGSYNGTVLKVTTGNLLLQVKHDAKGQVRRIRSQTL